jgi:hypothetical protein
MPQNRTPSSTLNVFIVRWRCPVNFSDAEEGRSHAVESAAQDKRKGNEDKKRFELAAPMSVICWFPDCLAVCRAGFGRHLLKVFE